MPGASSFSWNHVSNDEEAPIFFPSSEIRDDSVGEEEREWLLRRQEQPGWRVDNGAVIYQEEREKKKRSYLVETGRYVLWSIIHSWKPIRLIHGP